ncbi:MAG TPA: hypothetical protein VEN78_03180, partial [Bradyrhizobium sp.]|nr:hypothetical protein [Bradyrhizobium sp.]
MHKGAERGGCRTEVVGIVAGRCGPGHATQCVGDTIASASQRRRKPGDELDQIGLASNAGFFKQAA